jgi:HD-like signal output (HDOD) protein
MPAVAATLQKTLPPDLQQALARMGEISSLPEVTAKIVQIVEDPRATARDMHDIIRTDPALAAKILRVVNSAFYGLPSQVASLERAILLLGLSAVKNIALAASLSRLFDVQAVSEQFAARDLWRHCVAVGVAARLLASTAREPHVDEAFVAGLVHDMGLIVAQQLFPGKLRAVAAQCHERSEGFCALEQAVIGADHQAFGGALAAKWRFPMELRLAVAYHHEPLVLPPGQQKITATVYAADTLCSQGRYGFWLTGCAQELPDSMLELVRLSPAALEQVMEDLPGRVEEAERVFAD